MAPEMTQAEIDALNARRAYNRESYAKHREQRLQDKRDAQARLKEIRETTGIRWIEQLSERQKVNSRKAVNAYRAKRYNGTDEKSVHWWKQQIYHRSKQNARSRGISHDLRKEDVVWPDVCPVLGIKLNYGRPKNGRSSWDSPSIDRFDSSLGYTKDNCVVMSWRANMLKADGIAWEFEKLLSFMRRRSIV